jgi:hypothetical protein
MMAIVVRVALIVAGLCAAGLAQSYHAFFFDQKSDVAKEFEKQVAAARDTLTEFLRMTQASKFNAVHTMTTQQSSQLGELVKSVLEASRNRNRSARVTVKEALDSMQSARASMAEGTGPMTDISPVVRATEKILIDLRTNFSLEDRESIKQHFARYGEVPPAINNQDDKGFITTPFLQASEEDGDFFSSLKPGTFVGAIETVRLSKARVDPDSAGFPWKMDIKAGLVFAGALDVSDTLDFKRALLYPGTMNVLVAANVRPPFLNGRFAKVSLPNVTTGLKFVPGLRDTSATIVQISLACGAAVQIKSSIMAYGQVIWSRHDLTSESEASFGAAFPSAVDSEGRVYSSVTQYFLGLQFSVGEKEAQGRYFYLEWRKLDPGCRLGAPGGNKFLTFGFRNEITL